MSSITIASILMTLTAAFAYINFKLLKMPSAIGVMTVTMIFSIIVVIIGLVNPSITPAIKELLSHIDFEATLMHGMLSFLLFAGALHVNINDLKGQRIIVAILAVIGTTFSTAVVGLITYYLLPFLGIEISFIYCLLFGALISPTDPVAVMSILKKAGAPKSLETKVVGESLFNDGIAVVIFISLLGIATGGDASASHIALLFVEEAIGGAVFGGILGYIVNKMLATVDDYPVEILLTLGLVMGGYELARTLHTSGPIAMVIAGLIIGNHGRKHSMSNQTREHLDTFWTLMDEFMNAVLFMLIGLELLVLSPTTNTLIAGLIMIPTLLLIRFIAVGVPVTLMRKKHTFSPKAIQILTWGGLRGGISVALVLSLPAGEIREQLLVISYCIVIFSILIQGMTIGKLVASANKASQK